MYKRIELENVGCVQQLDRFSISTESQRFEAPLYFSILLVVATLTCVDRFEEELAG